MKCLLSLVLLLLSGSAFVLGTALSDQEKLAEIGKRLQQHVEQDAKRCYPKGNWGSKYAELQKGQLASPTGKRLVAIPHLSGMADRVVGFSTALMLAILTNRAFQMGKRGKLPAFEEAFESPSINWTREHDPDWLIEPLAEKANPRNYNRSVLDSKEYYAVNTINDVRLQDSFLRKDLVPILGGDARTTMFVGNRGKTIRMFENEHYNKRLVEEMGLTPYTLFGCLVNFLIQPKKEIFLPVFDQFKLMSDVDSKVLKISIQIRAGDHVWGNNKHNSEAEGKAVLASCDRYFACAKQIETFVLADHPDKYTSVVWYLATDSKTLRHAAAAHYGDKLITSLHTTLEHSAKESSVCQPNSGEACAVSSSGFTNAAAEWWMLGYADYHVITLYSGYGRTGGYRTLTTDRIYTLHDKPMECTKKSFTDQEKLMFDWSGI